MTPKHASDNERLTALNEKIQKLTSELDALYSERAGSIMWDAEDQALSAWCVCCGGNPVDVNNGYDTCAECVSRI